MQIDLQSNTRAAHLTCVGLTRAQANALPVWHCADCLQTTLLANTVDGAPTAQKTAPQDLADALADLERSTRVLQHVPRKDRHRVATDLAALIDAAVEQRTALAWWRMLSHAYIGLRKDKPLKPTQNANDRTGDTSSDPAFDNLL